MERKVTRVASAHALRLGEDTVILMGERPTRSKVDHVEIEKLLEELPARQHFSQQLYGNSEFDAAVTGRYNRRFSEYDFQSHRATPALSHRSHFRKSLRDPARDGRLQWRRSVTIHGVPKNSKRCSTAASGGGGPGPPETPAKGPGGVDGSCNDGSGDSGSGGGTAQPTPAKPRAAEEPLSLIEENGNGEGPRAVTGEATGEPRDRSGEAAEGERTEGDALPPGSPARRDTDEAGASGDPKAEGESEEAGIEGHTDRDSEERRRSNRDSGPRELQFKEEVISSPHGNKTQDESVEKVKRMSPVFTRNASYKHSKRASSRRTRRSPRVHDLQLQSEQRPDEEGCPDNRPATPQQQLSEVTDLEEASSLDQHALQRIANDAHQHHLLDSPQIGHRHPVLESKASMQSGHRYDDVGISRRRSKILKTPSPSARSFAYPCTRSHKPHELFVELDELQRSEQYAGIGASSIHWKEKARWIKFEEDREEGSNRWGKPHVASLTFNSLPQLRKGLEHGLVMLDIPETQLPAIFNVMVEAMLNAELIHQDNHGLVLRMLHQSARKIPAEQTSLFQASVRRLSLYTAGSESSRKASLVCPSPTANSSSAPTANTTTTLPASISPTVENHANGVDEVRISMLENSNNSNTEALPARRLTVHGDGIMRKIPAGSEAAVVMVATDDAVEEAVVAFVRLEEATVFENFLEVPLPVRFVFFMVGPSFVDTDYHEVGRAMATLFSDEVFRDIAYTGLDKHDILKGISEFLNDTMVLPPGDWDRDLLLPITRIQKKEQAKVMRRRLTNKPTKEDTDAVLELTKKMREIDLNMDPLQRTGRIFGGLFNDVKRRYPFYRSDITDALNFQCLAAFVFIYFACLSPAITFGGLLSEKTKKWMGVSEMIVSTSIGGMLFSLFSGQPLVIIGATGPLLVFEEQMFVFCETIGIEILPFRAWVGVWIFVISIVVVAFEGSILVRYFTRFTEEILTMLISMVFLYETFLGLYHTLCANPLLPEYCFGDGLHHAVAPPSNSSAGNSTYSVLSPDGNASQVVNFYDPPTTYTSHHATYESTEGVARDPSCLEADSSESLHGDTCSPGHWTPRPNTALLSIILTFGTFFISYFLQILRNSSFLGRTSRRAMGNFGIAIAIILMVSLDYLVQDTYTQKLSITDGFIPTDPCKRGWLINPLGLNYALPVGAVFGAIVPAFLLFILLYMEILLTGQFVSKKEHKLRKGTGFHLDLFLMGALSLLAGIFGLPWMCAGPVRTVSHLGSLTVLTRTEAPGVKPRLHHIKDQRMTNFAVSFLIGLTHFIAPLLREVPIAVLYGVFMYLGLSSLSGIQIIERIKIFFMPSKHHPDKKYVRMVKAWKMHMFTLLQIVSLMVLWFVKTSIISMVFPFGLILLVLIRRKVLGIFYTWAELEALDSEEEEQEGYETAE